MGYFKELDEMIQYVVGFDPDTRENESAYLQLRAEVDDHINDSSMFPFESLSNTAQELIRNWESLIEEREFNRHINVNSYYHTHDDGENWTIRD